MSSILMPSIVGFHAAVCVLSRPRIRRLSSPLGPTWIRSSYLLGRGPAPCIGSTLSCGSRILYSPYNSLFLCLSPSLPAGYPLLSRSAAETAWLRTSRGRESDAAACHDPSRCHGNITTLLYHFVSYNIIGCTVLVSIASSCSKQL